MHEILHVAVNYLWLALGIFWLIGALTAKRAQRTQSPGSRIVQFIPVTAAFFLLFSRPVWPHWLRRPFYPEGSLAFEWLGLALTATGIGFAIWARLWIGRNWSGLVTIKEHHELIQNGPYALVRHPIYSGFLLAMLGTALVHGELYGLLAFPLAALGWTLKLRMEESFMVQQFGSAYLDYKRRVKALVPFLV
jgi:protein-S-isoprenylcysteine O-methyltransferase Ste14